MIINTPKPPYYAVIFTSIRTSVDEGYAEMNRKLEELALQDPGCYGQESARNELGVSVSYWESPEAIRRWKANVDHRLAQQMGREKWYTHYKVRVCKVERDYNFEL